MMESMKKQRKQKNYAFIDSQNVNLGIKDQGWTLDFARFPPNKVDFMNNLRQKLDKKREAIT